MKIKKLFDLLDEYECNRRELINRYPDSQQSRNYMILLRDFVREKYGASLRGENDELFEQDISFDEFKNCLSSGQLGSFESYLMEQSKLPDKDQELAYRLIKVWTLEKHDEQCGIFSVPNEIRTKILGGFNIQDLARFRLVSEGFREISDGVSTSRYPNAECIPPHTLTESIFIYENDLRYYDGLLQNVPDEDDTLYKRGLVLRNLGRYKEALESFTHSLENRPNDAETLYAQGEVLYRLMRYQEALDSFNGSLRNRPYDTKTLYNRGCVLAKLKRYEEALRSIDDSLQPMCVTKVVKLLSQREQVERSHRFWFRIEDPAGQELTRQMREIHKQPLVAMLCMRTLILSGLGRNDEARQSYAIGRLINLFLSLTRGINNSTNPDNLFNEIFTSSNFSNAQNKYNDEVEGLEDYCERSLRSCDTNFRP